MRRDGWEFAIGPLKVCYSGLMCVCVGGGGGPLCCEAERWPCGEVVV
jgi:hypothetical protein